ncbi:type VI secretion system Vgr family protein [Luteimonas terrae]|uniref:Rhs element Vgr protein n=1 Tax=Luteimonas terrae TaxID=1530191 RepID=A0ABU1XV60_9GAMM|nr:type VI secretion system tip protein VgrG [Luteimonas terrae]MDR7192654.1 Rhs element Vgr protein [Luteimonas terrae]
MDAIQTALTHLRAAPGQQDRLLRLHTALGVDVLVPEQFAGEESLDGNGFRFEVLALSADAHLDLGAMLGAPLLLELLTSDTGYRPFHAHVTACERVGSNGGLARYRLVLEPWLAFLRHRVDSYVFQDMTVMDIVEDVLADYAGAGPLVPAWRWDLADRGIYARRSLTTQYQESDFAFLQRLLAEEGIYAWFEHEGDAASETRGAHTLVLADHADAFLDLGAVRYHRSDVTERHDSIQQWSDARRLQTARLTRASWDYRSLDRRPLDMAGQAHGDVAPVDSDTAGPYAWHDAASGERRIGRQVEALQVDACRIEGSGSWRALAPGGVFALTQHFAHRDPEGARFACVRVAHCGRNNLEAEVFDAAEDALGAWTRTPLGLPDGLMADADAPIDAWAEHAAKQPVDPREHFYRNTFSVIPAGVPYRPKTVDGHGLRAHPRPTVYGTQTAIVVSDGAPLQTDRDHRIKVQFPWQRGHDASGGEAHPGGDDNAPGTDSAWTWVRVATPWAGDNWGGVVVPRKGQEVLVAFLEGDIDRPVVIGALYNGRGQADAPHNQVASGGGGATGNAPSWFDGNAHAAVFTGLKSQALADSQTGSGGYQQLRLDDTPGQGRAQLATTQHQTTLTLGHLKGGQDNVREGERGFGVELSTDASGAVRAGAGLLLTTEPGTQQLAAPQALAQLAEGEQLLQALADTARSQQATLPEDPDTLTAQASLQALQEDLQATQQGSGGSGRSDDSAPIGGGDGEAPGWSAPQLLLGSPAGVMSLTPADQAWVSGTGTTLLAGSDLDWMSQAGTVVAAADGIALFTQGGKPPAGKPNQETGIALHAAQGKVSARAHKNEAKVAAKTSVTIASTQADVEISAPNKHVLLTAQGAYLKLEGGNIELGAPGVVEFKASRKELVGARSATAQPLSFGEAEPKFCELDAKRADAGGAGVVSLG